MIVILGVDPALNNTGYGIIFYNEESKIIENIKYGMFPIDKEQSTEQKLFTNFSTAERLIKENNADELVLENAFHNPNRAFGAAKVREAIGAIKVTAVQAGIPVYVYTAQQIKKSVGGNGRCTKEELAEKVSEISGLNTFTIKKCIRKKEMELELSPAEMIKNQLDHVTDAIAIAYCRFYEKLNEI